MICLHFVTQVLLSNLLYVMFVQEPFIPTRDLETLKIVMAPNSLSVCINTGDAN